MSDQLHHHHRHPPRSEPAWVIATGAVISGPATKALDVYDVQELEGRIHIRA
jgi:nitrite reductase/ring-hydroxylating ferredoxin subunit